MSVVPWRRWLRRAHRGVLRRLRTPSASALRTANDSASGADMPLLSALYSRIIDAKRTRELASAQRISPPRIPVVSVGNFTFGATGKTPAVLYLAETILQEASKRSTMRRVPMLLTRGYGDDEWRMFASRFPECKVVVGADRLSLGRAAATRFESELSCVLLEDGLQQWKIVKDLEVVMVDALSPFGNGKLIPHGSLRELPRDALARADVVLVHNATAIEDSCLRSIVDAVEALVPADRKVTIGTSEFAITAAPALASYASDGRACNDAVDWRRFKGKTALVVCGVGNPESVEGAVRAMGPWKRVEVESFPDHHSFTPDDMEDIRARADALSESDEVVIITTEKDAARSAHTMQAVLRDSPHAVHVLVGEFRLNSHAHEVLNHVINTLF